MHLNPRLTHRFYCRRQKGSAEQFPPEVIASAAKQSSFLLSRGFLYCHVASLLSMNLSLGAAFCVEACALDRCECFHRPAAGEALFGAEKSRKRLAPDRTHAQLLLRLCPALLSECGPAPTRASTPTPASMPSVAARPRSLCSLRPLRRYAARSVKQWCLAPAFGCDARRALRRVIALGPRIPALPLRFSVSSHRIMVLRQRVLDFLALSFAFFASFADKKTYAPPAGFMVRVQFQTPEQVARNDDLIAASITSIGKGYTARASSAVFGSVR